ncbi:PEGA domain-containing protein [Candidatus Gottesmanbacteria bacterium]|nr:PEGA domain-containing protein [Candidatus Gottesmanbacteria bacterium]
MIIDMRKQKLGVLIGILALVGLVVWGIKSIGGGGSKESVLKVASNPVASVFLDNKHVGRTPVETNVASGEYSLRLVPESSTQTLASWQGNVRIAPDILTYVNAGLGESEFTTTVETMWLEKISSKLAEVSITTNPDGATVSLDGETKGISPISVPNVSAGDHSLAIASPGFLSKNTKLKTTAGYKLNAVIKLALNSASPPEASPSPIITDELGASASKPSGKTTPTPTKAVSSSDPAKPFVTIKDTPTGFLRVRMEPTTGATEAAQVKPGEKFTIQDSQEDAKGTTWYEIKYDGKNSGWISGTYATKTE